MSGFFDAIDYALRLEQIFSGYQSMTEEEGKPSATLGRKEISRSSKLGRNDTRTLTNQQIAFDRLEPHLWRHFGSHMENTVSNYVQNGLFFLKTMNSFPDFTKSCEDSIENSTSEDAVWNTLLAPQIALILAACENSRISLNEPTSAIETVAKLIADWKPDLYKSGLYGKIIIKKYLNMDGDIQVPEFTTAINKRGIKGVGYRTIKEHIEILESELRMSDANNIEIILARAKSAYEASVIMYRLETMEYGDKRLSTIKSYLTDSMYLLNLDFDAIHTSSDIPEGILEKPYLVSNFYLFRTLAYRTPDQTALDIFRSKLDPDPHRTPIQLFAQERLIEFYYDMKIDIREWMAIIWPKQGSSIWPVIKSNEYSPPIPDNKDMKILSDYWALYYCMYHHADIGNYTKAYELCKLALEVGEKFHAGEYHASVLIHMVVLSTKLEDFKPNEPKYDATLNKNKVDGLLAELAYLLPDDGRINPPNDQINAVIHGSADELLYSLAFRIFNEAHNEKVSPFKRLECMCKAALEVVSNNPDANLSQRVKLYKKILREGTPRISASTPLLNYSSRLDPDVFINGILDLSYFYGFVPDAFLSFHASHEAQKLFIASYNTTPNP